MDLAAFNADWLKAWTDKDVPRLLTFYAEDTVYKDNQTVAGITGQSPFFSTSISITRVA